MNPVAADGGALPVACTLGPADGPQRVRRWRELTAAGRPTVSVTGPVLQARFRPGPGILAELRSLTEAERECCPFLTWTVIDGDDGPVLTVVAAPGRPDDLQALLTMVDRATHPTDR